MNYKIVLVLVICYSFYLTKTYTQRRRSALQMTIFITFPYMNRKHDWGTQDIVLNHGFLHFILNYICKLTVLSLVFMSSSLMMAPDGPKHVRHTIK